jgi:DNA-binding transcriptional LysR family regulator
MRDTHAVPIETTHCRVPAAAARRLDRLPEITELLTFVIAADEQSLSRAASRLHLTAAAIAKRLDNLEAVIGQKLLDRGPRGVRLTPEGRGLYPRAEQLVEASQALLEQPWSPSRARLSGLHALLHRPAARSAEALAAELELLVEDIFNVAPAGIALVRITDETLIEMNDAFCGLVGYPREELLGRPSVELDLWASLDQPERAGVAVRTGSGEVRKLDMRGRRIKLAQHDILLVAVSHPAG